MSTQLNLKELAVRRDASTNSLEPRRHFLSRYILPGILVAGFLGLTGWAVRDSWLPRKPVRVIPVHASVSQIRTAGTPLFKAAGWIEPRPTPIRVAALAPGVVEALLVVEDQVVEAGEPIARLVSRDAELAVEQAEAAERMRKAETNEAQSVLTEARTNLEHPTKLQLAVAEADAELAAVETELTSLPKQLKRAEARRALAKTDWEAKSANRESIQPLLLARAQSELTSAEAEVEELTQRGPALERQREALSRKQAVAAKRLELKTEELRALAAAEAHFASFEAQWHEAQSRATEARLRLERMTIRAPVSGRVLSLIANPGSQLMTGPSQMESRDSNTVVTMYQPDRMQVRVDVRFEDLPRVGRDQPVQIKSPAWPEVIPGRVLFLTSFANVQKNTLAVKVAIESPPSVLKPEMLVDVTFIAPERADVTKSEDRQEYQLFLPTEVVETTPDGSSVWIADLSSRIARRQPVELGTIRTATMVQITSGLTVGSRVISEGRGGLQEGDRIDVQGEDSHLGSAAIESSSIKDAPQQPTEKQGGHDAGH